MGRAALQRGDHHAEIRESPLHGDFIVPVELFFAALVGRIDKDTRFRPVESEAHHTSVAAGVRLVNRIFRGALGVGAGIEAKLRNQSFYLGYEKTILKSSGNSTDGQNIFWRYTWETP